jgi:CRP-like cAMP-binding protein
MFTLREHSDDFYRDIEASKEILGQIFSSIELPSAVHRVPRNHRFFDLPEERSNLFLIKDGFLRFERNGRPVLFMEPGELLGWGNHFSGQLEVISDCAVELARVSKNEFFGALGSRPELSQLWNSYIEGQFRIYTALLAEESCAETGSVEPDRRFFGPGEPIIIQGTSNSEVYTLLHGRADVYVQDTCVGSVLTGEIFGAMAATTNTSRTASVIARTPCVVSALPKEEFLSFIKTRPRTVLKLIEDMARIIVTQNDKIVEMGQHLKTH